MKTESKSRSIVDPFNYIGVHHAFFIHSCFLFRFFYNLQIHSFIRSRLDPDVLTIYVKILAIYTYTNDVKYAVYLSLSSSYLLGLSTSVDDRAFRRYHCTRISDDTITGVLIYARITLKYPRSSDKLNHSMHPSKPWDFFYDTFFSTRLLVREVFQCARDWQQRQIQCPVLEVSLPLFREVWQCPRFKDQLRNIQEMTRNQLGIRVGQYTCVTSGGAISPLRVDPTCIQIQLSSKAALLLCNARSQK